MFRDYRGEFELKGLAHNSAMAALANITSIDSPEGHAALTSLIGRLEMNSFDQRGTLMTRGHVVHGRALDEMMESTKFIIEAFKGEYFRARRSRQRILRTIETLDIATASLQRRIGEHVSTLAYFRGDVRNVIVEKFLNERKLEITDPSESLHIFKNQGVATLPISGERTLPIKILSIAKNSNGVNGNGDREVTPEVGYLSSITDGNPDTWFEYEKMNTGPLRLNLEIIFDKETIVNYLKFGFVSPGDSKAFIIDDIVFNDTQAGIVSIKNITPDEYRNGFWKSVRSDSAGVWDVVFLPVETKTIIVRLVQRDSINVIRNSQLRKRFVIGVQSIEAKCLSFKDTGNITSTGIGLRNFTYKVESELKVFPESLFNFKINTTIGNDVFKQSDLVKTTVLDGQGGPLVYKLTVTRNNDRIKRAASVLPGSEVYDLNSATRAIQTTQSPASISLRENLVDSKIFMMQPRVLRVGDVEPYSTFLFQTHTVDLPFTLIEKKSEMTRLKVTISDEEFEYVENLASLSGNTYTINSKQTKMILSPDWISMGNLKLSLSPQPLDLELTPNGYRAEFTHLFDPDKNTIDIFTTEGMNLPYTKTISRRGLTHDLEVKRINLTTFDMQSDGSTQPIRKDTFGLVTLPQDYAVDAEEGAMRIGSPTGADLWTAQFEASPYRKLKKEEYEVVFDNLKPSGILIKADSIVTFFVQETVSDDLLYRNDPVTGDWEQTTILATSVRARKLSYENVIKGSLRVSRSLIDGEMNPQEIDFIDGSKEFYGAIRTTERTNRVAPTGGLVSFGLAARGLALTSDGFGLSFSSNNKFLNRVEEIGLLSAEGDYFISGLGIITIKTTTFLPADILISYFYRDSEFVPDNKYSVDYKNGILYAYGNIRPAGVIKYEVCPSIAKYYVAKEIEDFTYDEVRNSIEFPVEQLVDVPGRNVAKVFWRKLRGAQDAQKFQEYFSPLIDSLTYRFF